MCCDLLFHYLSCDARPYHRRQPQRNSDSAPTTQVDSDHISNSFLRSELVKMSSPLPPHPRYYHVCERCNAKFYVPRSVDECPRCGTLSSSRERHVPPWQARSTGRTNGEPGNNGHAACRVVDDLQALVDAGESFRCIYADPPWRFDNRASRGAAANHYSTMSLEEICAMPVSVLAETNAHLHLWTTNSFLFDAKRVIDAWGFRYKSCFVWVKPQMGLGNYWRLSHEFLLLGVRGQVRFGDRSLRSWLKATRTTHSTKPDKIREFVERASPAPRLELFGRRTSPGWTVYGNSVERRLF